MAHPPSLLLSHLRRLAALAAPEPTSDAELLRRFAEERDEAAFAALVGRHGPVVLGVCRRVLHDAQQAEDVFQATFLVLARKAGCIRHPQTLAAWLHGMARNLALKCQRAEARRGRREAQVARNQAAASPDPLAELSARELLRIVDEEVQRLPKIYRTPVILCCLEGKTQEEAAQQLGWTPGCVKGRLERGRQRLRARLASRGVALATALTVVGSAARAALPPLLATRTVRAALLFEAGNTAAGISAEAVALAREALHTAPAMMARWMVVLVLTAGVLAAGVGAFMAPSPASPQLAPGSHGIAAVGQRHAPIRVDRHGDPLPRGALARLGTVRFRQGYCVYQAAWSPDQRSIGTVGWNGGLRLWDAVTGRLRWQNWPSASLQRLAFSPDGQLVVCEGPGSTIVLLDAQTGREKRRLAAGNSNVLRLAFAPDGRTLAVVGWSSPVRLLDVSTGKVLHQLQAHQERTGALAFSPDSKTLATAGEKGSITLWDPATGKELRRLSGHSLEIYGLAFSPDSTILASASADATVREWQVATGKQIRLPGKPEPKAPWPQSHAMGSVAFSPDGKYLAAGRGDGEIILREEATGREVRRWQAHADLVRSLAFSPDGKTLLSSAMFSSDPRQWEVPTGREIHPTAGHHGPVNHLQFSADGRRLISGSVGKEVLRWDVATARVARRFRWQTDSSSRFAVSPDGKQVATWRVPDLIIRPWDRTTGRAIGTFGAHRLPAVGGSFDCMTFSPNSQLLAAATSDHAVQLWDIRTRKEYRRLGGCASDLRMVVFSLDGKRLAGGSQTRPGNLYIWDVATGRQLSHINTPDPAEVLAFSPDGSMLACGGGYDRPVRLFDIASGQQVHELSESNRGLTSLAFSPDGRFLAAGGWTDAGDLACVWELSTAQRVRRFSGGTGLVLSLAFSPDSLTLATGSADSTILLWDLTGRQEHGRLRTTTLTKPRLDLLWAKLAGEPSEAFDAYWELVAAPSQTVPFLATSLRPDKPADGRRVAQLIRDLDSRHFAVRQRATEELKNLGEAVAPLLHQALAGQLSAEANRRIHAVLASWDWQQSPARFRLLRALDILARIGTPEARAILRKLADGLPNTRLTREATKAFRDLRRRSGP